ncbi:MAG: RNA-guided pseudouridylation complex pseudouridine synthase subunit Cbf5 [Candidatus Pacearchaeota archaeon]
MIDIAKIRREKQIAELLKFSIINIDKPSGPTSFSVSQFVKNALKINKTSHFGTLDPIVSGVLPVALGRACRLNDYFIHKDKTYVGIVRLHADIDDKKLKEEIKNFIGKIKQLPPLRSRVKRVERIREVKRFEVLEREGKDILFLAEVEAGTYIRKLCDDLGKKIGGAHMLELRRIKAGIFDEKNSVNLYDFEKAVDEYKKGNEEMLRKILIPAEIISDILPVVQANPSNIKKLLTGKPLMKNDIETSLKYDKFVLFLKEKFIGVYRKTNESDIIARPEFVLN